MSDATYDEVIKGGTVIDGTGAPGRIADIAIRDGKIVAIGEVDGDATIVTDATGRMIMPGVIDAHTHYDAQLLWDPGASPSANHGVTTVIAGNCGFTLAPLRPTKEEAKYLQEMMSRVEGIPPEDVRIGMAVRARIVAGEEGPIVVFTPEGAA